jgi:hypothetical protein
LIGIAAVHIYNYRGSLARHTGNTPASIEAVRPNKKRHRVRLRIDAAHLHVKTQRTSRLGKPLAAFAYGVTALAAKSFDFDRAFRRGSRLAGRVLRFGSGCASNPIRTVGHATALSCWAVPVLCGVTFDARLGTSDPDNSCPTSVLKAKSLRDFKIREE